MPVKIDIHPPAFSRFPPTMEGVEHQLHTYQDFPMIAPETNNRLLRVNCSAVSDCIEGSLEIADAADEGVTPSPQT